MDKHRISHEYTDGIQWFIHMNTPYFNLSTSQETLRMKVLNAVITEYD